MVNTDLLRLRILKPNACMEYLLILSHNEVSVSPQQSEKCLKHVELSLLMNFNRNKLEICIKTRIYQGSFNKISREKFEPEPGFEPRTSRFLVRLSTTLVILVLMPAHVQISLLRRMPL